MAGLDGDQRIIATAHHIISTLGSADTDDMLRILSSFDDRFAHMSVSLPREAEPGLAAAAAVDPQPAAMRDASETNADPGEEVETILDSAEKTVMKWEFVLTDSAPLSMIWEDHPDEAASYLEAVDTVQNFIDYLSMHAIDRRDKANLDRAQNILQLAMSRLEDEFRHLIEKNSESVDPDWLFNLASSSSFEANTDDAPSHSSPGDTQRGGAREVSSSRSIREMKFIIDMLPQESVPDLSDIAKRMVGAGYKTECCQVYVSIRKAILEESLHRLGYEKLSIEEVLKITWNILENDIEKWLHSFKVAVGVIFASEKRLCDQVFAFMASVSESCFAELAKGAMTQLLTFAEAIAIGRRSPEKLFKILDMYERLRDDLPDIESIFAGAACASVRAEASGILTRLGEAARGTFGEFENAVQRESSKNPVPGGAVHPLTKYVMNYVKFLSDYKDTLNNLLLVRRNEAPSLLDDDVAGPPVGSPARDDKVKKGEEFLLSAQTASLLQLLENNLDAKSKFYKDLALGYLFLMNNIHHVVQKVKESEVRKLLGDDWVRRHTGKVRQYHNGYQRAAWTKVLACLKDVSGSFSSSVSRNVLKDRFKSFNTAFEEILKTQSSWIVSDEQLCTELRISIAEMLLPAYRSFLGRFRNHIDVGKHSEKYLKYTTEDLESKLNDLFEGSSGSMNKK